MLRDGTLVSGGGRDGRLVQYDAQYQHTGREAQLPDQLGGIRTVTEGGGTQAASSHLGGQE